MKKIGICGIACYACKLFKSGCCHGCSDKVDSCPIAYCAYEKGIKHCYFCEDFPCIIYSTTRKHVIEALVKKRNPLKPCFAYDSILCSNCSLPCKQKFGIPIAVLECKRDIKAQLTLQVN